MGSSSKFDYQDYSASEIYNKIKNAGDETKTQQFEVEINGLIEKELSKFNNRDNEKISSHIASIKAALNKEIDGTVSTNFGGSLSKNTHLTGLSDVDTLVILNKSELINSTPQQVLNYFAGQLKKRFPSAIVTKGDTCVTVKFKDVDVQLIPAIKYKSGLKIPDSSEWSNIINPTIFARSLTVLNKQLQGKLIPAIKILKGIIFKSPADMRLSGYHIESLALQIFKNNLIEFPSGQKNKDLIKTFFKEASKDIRTPIRDVSKQNDKVDEYLGAKNSVSRLRVADALERIYRKIEMADSGRLNYMWKEILAID